MSDDDSFDRPDQGDIVTTWDHPRLYEVVRVEPEAGLVKVFPLVSGPDDRMRWNSLDGVRVVRRADERFCPEDECDADMALLDVAHREGCRVGNAEEETAAGLVQALMAERYGEVDDVAAERPGPVGLVIDGSPA